MLSRMVLCHPYNIGIKQKGQEWYLHPTGKEPEIQDTVTAAEVHWAPTMGLGLASSTGHGLACLILTGFQ